MKPEDCIVCIATGSKKCPDCIQAEKRRNDPTGLKEFLNEKFAALHSRIDDLEKHIKDLQFDNDVRDGKIQ